MTLANMLHVLAVWPFSNVFVVVQLLFLRMERKYDATKIAMKAGIIIHRQEKRVVLGRNQRV